MRKISAALLIYLGLASAALAQGIIPATTGSVSIATGPISQLKIVSGVSGKQIYVTSISLVPAATATVQLSYGSGTNCNANNVALTGVMTFSAGQVLAVGDGYGAILVVPVPAPGQPANDLCIQVVTAGAPGFIAYAQM